MGDLLFREQFEVLQPLFEGDEAEIREYHEENLRTCDGVLIFYGAANEMWLRRKLRELQKSAGYGRTKPPAGGGICLLPPDTPEKERVPHARGARHSAVGRLRPGRSSRRSSRACAGAEACQVLTASQPRFNPFPGLRPFEPDEDHLFFGRETEIDELLRRLRSTRFLSVVGTSGCGKSSLVRSGSDPVAPQRLMVQAGSSWRVAMMRPGEDPIGHLAAALDAPDVLGERTAELADHQRACCSKRRCAAAARAWSMPSARRTSRPTTTCSSSSTSSRSCSASSEPPRSTTRATRRSPSSSCCSRPPQQQDLPIYVVLTMRSDFIGDCMEYPGLPEALNNGQYLVPRMTRDELRSADHRARWRSAAARSRRGWCCAC